MTSPGTSVGSSGSGEPDRGVPEVVVQPTSDALAGSVADRAVATLAAAVTARGEAHLVVTGGSILEKVLAGMAPRADAFDWSAVHVWWGDERFVPSDSDERNDRPAMAKLFDLVPVDPAKVHRMPASDVGFDDAEAAADAYQQAMLDAGGGSVPPFDVILLGLGPDGHCASLFPGHPGTQVTGRPVIAVHDSPKPPPDRLSLTFEGLDAAREIWLIASGDGKADAVAKAVGGDESLPSARPRGRERTLWLLDEDAASQLPS
ncbi:6-phosphogluconolactonase [Jatrophihabitans fulvus]